MYSQVLQKSKPQVCFFLKTFLVCYIIMFFKYNYTDCDSVMGPCMIDLQHQYNTSIEELGRAMSTKGTTCVHPIF